MKIKELIDYGRKMLIEQEDSILISKILLSHFLKEDKTYLIINQYKEVDEKIEQEYKIAIENIKLGYPLQYITNMQEFMKLKFYVNEDVLIPRQDTEILVEEVIKLADKEKQIKILDMCTGSGAIGISLAKYLPNAEVYMADISPKALSVAEKNIISNNVTNKVKLINSNMFKNISDIKFDVIVSNPPYIETETINKLDKQVQKEPIIALDGGKDGLAFYKILAMEGKYFLKQGGVLALEIGYNQKEKVIELLSEEGVYKDIYCKKDLSGNDRIVIGKLI